MALYVVYGCGFIGVIVGFIWAERIRKTLGIVTFTAYLLSTPEIDGWRDISGNRVKRKVT
ncbi:hypothetical protein [Litorilituus sediminis]|uniref:Uncharacterized protein n=1 Tax=Litorilituus sediminis TaxID=718192 RepID=A0A4P6P0K1_9GAMM|nr:hypothetical protein [Litorilituus sediminis]QBG34636.1 hypothetical protein EMK97_02210 [Litorilituus sediminis]